MSAARCQGIVRSELNTWYQPEHPRGAWLRAVSDVRPEAAAALRAKLAAIPLPDRAYRLSPARPVGILAYAAAVAVIAAAFRMSSLPAIYQAAGWASVSLLLGPMGAAAWRRLRYRRRLQAAADIRGALEREGARLAAILDNDA